MGIIYNVKEHFPDYFNALAYHPLVTHIRSANSLEKKQKKMETKLATATLEIMERLDDLRGHEHSKISSKEFPLSNLNFSFLTIRKDEIINNMQQADIAKIKSRKIELLKDYHNHQTIIADAAKVFRSPSTFEDYKQQYFVYFVDQKIKQIMSEFNHLLLALIHCYPGKLENHTFDHLSHSELRRMIDIFILITREYENVITESDYKVFQFPNEYRFPFSNKLISGIFPERVVFSFSTKEFYRKIENSLLQLYIFIKKHKIRHLNHTIDNVVDKIESQAFQVKHEIILKR